MSDKYIIRNCNVLYFNPDKTAICNDLMIECPCYCKDRTDCLLKRIVEYCKSENEFYNNKVYKKDVELGRAIAAGNVLQLLDIQECEND